MAQNLVLWSVTLVCQEMGWIISHKIIRLPATALHRETGRLSGGTTFGLGAPGVSIGDSMALPQLLGRYRPWAITQLPAIFPVDKLLFGLALITQVLCSSMAHASIILPSAFMLLNDGRIPKCLTRETLPRCLPRQGGFLTRLYCTPQCLDAFCADG